MLRYDIESSGYQPGWVEVKADDGDWVWYDDAQSEIDRLREALRQTRASILGWQPDEPTPMRAQMAAALRRINEALTPPNDKEPTSAEGVSSGEVLGTNKQP